MSKQLTKTAEPKYDIEAAAEELRAVASKLKTAYRTKRALAAAEELTVEVTKVAHSVGVKVVIDKRAPQIPSFGTPMEQDFDVSVEVEGLSVSFLVGFLLGAGECCVRPDRPGGVTIPFLVYDVRKDRWMAPPTSTDGVTPTFCGVLEFIREIERRFRIGA